MSRIPTCQLYEPLDQGIGWVIVDWRFKEGNDLLPSSGSVVGHSEGIGGSVRTEGGQVGIHQENNRAQGWASWTGWVIAFMSSIDREDWTMTPAKTAAPGETSFGLRNGLESLVVLPWKAE